ncbi:hypothetical protein [Solimicrobium silvestre]|uniref:DUF2975 domain-containing protein n=1 Tax=Solimicrobium silvestre TaxID=2099400 RepID=A0A2S9H3K6_9BURK|nr:hypothetical protein [Solimicrobium silvestre]PRC94547.1 hypothetical protein S2091_0550 [Solimicrobium silvestre]
MSRQILTLPVLCRVLRYGVGTLLIATLIAHFWVWLSLGDVKLGTFTFLIHSGDLDAKELSEMPILIRVLTILVSLPALFFLTVALIRLLRLMHFFEKKEIFVMPSILLLKGFSGAIFLYILCSMVEPVVRMLVFTLVGSTQGQELVLHLTDSFDELLLCGMFYVIVRIMEEGRRLAEENSEFI